MTKTLEQRIIQVLDNNDGKCLDNESERKEVAAALFDMLGEWLDEYEKSLANKFIHGLSKIKAGIEADNFTREDIDALIKRLRS